MAKKIKHTVLHEDTTPIKVEHYVPPEKTAALSPTETQELYRLLQEQARRSVESLKLYEPLPIQDAFHGSMAPERVLRGSNRGGKTLPAAVEVARAVTGQDPYGKWPKTNGRFFLVGKDGSHLAQVMWHKLSRAGAFKIIRDQETSQWRSYRPWDPLDVAYAKMNPKEIKPAPPLIPPRMIKEIAWENKKEAQPRIVRLINGWELVFYSSLGKPPNGVDVDGVWFDEEIIDPEWYSEMSARLLDRSGRFLWSATPQAGTEQMYALHEKAVDQVHEEEPTITEHIILLSDNPHISEKEKAAFAAKLTEEDRNVRIGGEFALLSRKMYPEWSESAHGIPYFQPPVDWCRYMVVDPGHQICAVLFAAVPPPGLVADKSVDAGIYVYDELYLKGCDAHMFAKEVQVKCLGQQIQAFIIDHQGGNLTDLGSGKRVEDQYSEALRQHKVKSIATGYHFIPGSTDVKGGILAVRSLLRVRENGKPRLRVVRETCPNLEKEFKYYRKRVIAKEVRDEPDPRSRSHLLDCLRYLAMYDPPWVAPPAANHSDRGAYNAFKRKEKRLKAKEGKEYVNLGPGS